MNSSSNRRRNNSIYSRLLKVRIRLRLSNNHKSNNNNNSNHLNLNQSTYQVVCNWAYNNSKKQRLLQVTRSNSLERIDLCLTIRKEWSWLLKYLCKTVYPTKLLLTLMEWPTLFPLAPLFLSFRDQTAQRLWLKSLTSVPKDRAAFSNLMTHQPREKKEFGRQLVAIELISHLDYQE